MQTIETTYTCLQWVHRTSKMRPYQCQQMRTRILHTRTRVRTQDRLDSRGMGGGWKGKAQVSLRALRGASR